MTILIIDDEPKARSLLCTIINESGEENFELLTANDLMEGVELIQTMKPDLVFLDIEMPNHQGIEIFNFLEIEVISFDLVFTTAYSQYAIQAFEMNAIDYILKPLRPRRVIEVLKRVRASRDRTDLRTKLDELKQFFKSTSFNKIGLPTAEGILFIPLEDLIHLEADGMYTSVYTVNNDKQLVSKPLKHFEHLVTLGKGFYRPHRSHIFNMKFLKQYVKKDGNYVILENDHVIPIAKEKRDAFLEAITL